LPFLELFKEVVWHHMLKISIFFEGYERLLSVRLRQVMLN
jgi:hypothetical protein